MWLIAHVFVNFDHFAGLEINQHKPVCICCPASLQWGLSTALYHMPVFWYGQLISGLVTCCVSRDWMIEWWPARSVIVIFLWAFSQIFIIFNKLLCTMIRRRLCGPKGGVLPIKLLNNRLIPQRHRHESGRCDGVVRGVEIATRRPTLHLPRRQDREMWERRGLSAGLEMFSLESLTSVCARPGGVLGPLEGHLSVPHVL